MNIDLLSKMVLELIIENDRVVLPFFGVFTAEVVPSSFSDRGYTLNPPYRRLHFRASSQSDNMLASFYAKANSIDLDTAFKIVSDFTKELRNVLLKSKVLVFPGLGRIRTTKENNFFFVPVEDLDIYPEGFGLKPISLKAHRAGSNPKIASKIEDNPDISAVQTDSMVDAVSASSVGEEVIRDNIQDEQETEEVLEHIDAEHLDVETNEQNYDAEPEEVESSEADGDEQGKIVSESKVKAENEREEKSERKGLKIVIAVVLGLIALAGLLLLVFLLLSDLCPAFIDSLLYTPEELEILNYKY